MDIDRIVGFAQQMRESMPADLQEAYEVLRQKESIVNQAYLEAKRIKDGADNEASAITKAAQKEYALKVDQTEITKAAHVKAQGITEEAIQESRGITQEAQEKAFRMLSEAEKETVGRREGADNYAREVLADLEEQMSEVLTQIRKGMDQLSIDIETRAA